MKIKAQVEYEISPFQVPNFVRPVRSREDGVSEEVQAIPLSDLSPETLDTLCNKFRDGVFKKAGKQQPPRVDSR